MPGTFAHPLAAALAALAFTGSCMAQEEPPVRNGIDVLVRDRFAQLAGLRVGLITNQTGIDRERHATLDLLAAAPGVKLVALFSPEHGIRGALDQAKIDDSRDEKTGLPIYSLYGERRFPLPSQLADLDALVFDIQDIGCRFYTYMSTLQLALEAAGKAKKKFFVLDRVNPVGGDILEGPVQVKKESFVACHALPLRHGMTPGELATMFNGERNLRADLTVIRVEGWRRPMFYDETGLPWVNPSPNMRSLAAALLYPGVGLLESAISVGRGTDAPFEILGAPYADDVRLARELNSAGLAGVRFTPVRFTPVASIFKGQVCHGVRIFITDRAGLRAVDVGTALAVTFRRLYPKEFKLAELDRLLQHPATLEAVREGRPWTEIRAAWLPELRDFERRRAPFLLY